jgi:hypothetical protein
VELDNLITAVQSGGNIAYLIGIVYIHKVVERLARIEKALDRYMEGRPPQEEVDLAAALRATNPELRRRK